MDDWVEIQRDEAHIKRERAKARQLRNTPYFQELLRKGGSFPELRFTRLALHVEGLLHDGDPGFREGLPDQVDRVLRNPRGREDDGFLRVARLQRFQVIL